MRLMEMRKGVRLADTYELVHPLGRGGMAQVWAAKHARLGHKVAIKLPAQDGPEHVDRFLREARLAASVSHRHVVRVIDVGSDPAAPFMAMELVEGRTLEDLLGTLTDEEAVTIVGQLLSALEACHAAGVVHRDLKPENVFVERDPDHGPHVTLVDFGISKAMGDERSAIPTREGAVIGTPEYMAPEQARGQAVDHRVDVYSAGVLLYELLSGRLPFQGATPINVLSAVLDGNPRPFERPDLPELALVVRCAMEMDPDQRYPDARAMRRAMLEAAVADLGIVRESTGRFLIPTPPSPVRSGIASDQARSLDTTAGHAPLDLEAPARTSSWWKLPVVALPALVIVSWFLMGSATASIPGPKTVLPRVASVQPAAEPVELPAESVDSDDEPVAETQDTAGPAPSMRRARLRRVPTTSEESDDTPTIESASDRNPNAMRETMRGRAGVLRELDF